MLYNEESLVTLKNKLSMTNPEDALVLKLALDELRDREYAIKNLNLSLVVEYNRNIILSKCLETYADKNFWIRVPAYSLAAADKGSLASQALRDAQLGENLEDGSGA